MLTKTYRVKDKIKASKERDKISLIEKKYGEYYAIIPNDILFDRLIPPKYKILYGLLFCMSLDKGYAMFNTDEITLALDITPAELKRILTFFYEAGYLVVQENYTSKTKLYNTKIYLKHNDEMEGKLIKEAVEKALNSGNIKEYLEGKKGKP